ncbi:hypothetical protein CTKA_00756 [Chthonomonas calidirosea]|uniref:Uncharacterized protein n=1 Tax=Chthonomonas calidirosea (strain DSM 23976 / ICMP 18418 / T49) TaxID=1303518 RepID=S0ET53_CHTCT|nr:hypothetical protein [Chthonomonas calidirosea]CCW34235.1 hypothetical protein CCALI_00400 [Chthonomonas calidirosea T49]CEK15364.1 hypothetical protein CTKA_00756 [Chthonomonas calidirosea]
MGKCVEKYTTIYVALGTILGVGLILLLAPSHSLKQLHAANGAATIVRQADEICSESFLHCTALTQPIYHSKYYWAGPRSQPYDVWETTGITDSGPVQMIFDAHSNDLTYFNRENCQVVEDSTVPVTVPNKTQAAFASANILETLHLIPRGASLRLAIAPYLLWGGNVWETVWIVHSPHQSSFRVSLTIAKRGGYLLNLIKRRLPSS